MFTSRAEYRILLRQDNADVRLTPIALKLGMKGAEQRMQRVEEKLASAEKIEKFFRDYSVAPEQINSFLESVKSAPLSQKVKLHSVLLRPHIGFDNLSAVIPELSDFLNNHDIESKELAEINMKYDGYIRREQEMVEKMNRLEEVRLRRGFDYKSLKSLSAEAREKLTTVQPETIGQASRISGVSPADISVLLVHMGR